MIVGAGSTGGYFGGRLAQAGRDVTFLVRPRRAAQLEKDGLRIVSPHGDAAVTPKLVTAGNIAAPFDAVFLTVKAYSLEAALDDFAAAVGPETMILPVLNGMRHVDVLTARFGKPAVAGCVCKVATLIDPEGRIVQLNKLQDLAYGEMDGALSPRMQRLDATMQGAGFEARLSRAIVPDMWEKWVLLATLGGITCLMRGHVGLVGAAPGGKAFILGVLDEVVAIATAVGYPPNPNFVATIRTQLTAPGSTQAPSMFRDMQQGSPIEADQIVGDLLARGAKANVPTPLLAASYASMSIYQRGLDGAR
ncbi:MAG: ketopantoate reductase family protein [Pseudomonadota bacterium]